MTETADVQDEWSRVAPGYDEHVTPSNIPIAERALQMVELRPGERVLDVAAGSGAMSIPAARLGGKVVAVDISDRMVDRLERRAKDEGLSNLESHVMDGQALEFEADTFDVAASQFGVMLFPDLPRGLAEMVRVTKPGGRVLIVAMGPPTAVEFLEFFQSAIEAVVPDFHGLPTDPPPLPFQLADPARLRDELTTAGLSEIRVETATHRLTFASGRQMWAWVTASNPIGAKMVADLTEAQSLTAKQTLDEMLAERAGGSGPAVLENAVNIGVGTK